MKYGRGTCSECKRSVLTTDDGRAIAHPAPGGTAQCGGSAEPCSQAVREAARPKPLPSPAAQPSNGHTPELKIEKGVPVPKARRGREGRFRKALLAMEVGDSFACAANGNRSTEGAIRDAARKAGVKITMRRLDAGSVRVWRVQ